MRYHRAQHHHQPVNMTIFHTNITIQIVNQTKTQTFFSSYPILCYAIILSPLEIITTADNLLHGRSKQNGVLILGSVRALLINQRGISLDDALRHKVVQL